MSTKGAEEKSTYIGDGASGCAEPLPSSTPHSESLELLPPAKRQRTSVISIPFLLSSTEDTTTAASNSDNVETERDFEMSDGKNEARALRIVEIMNDFRTLQVHIESLVSRGEATPPDQQSYNLVGYQLLRQCNADAQTILALKFDAGNLGIEPGRIPDTEVQKATLQRILLDAATRRFQAHKIYLRASSGMRWVKLRQQLMASGRSQAVIAEGLQRVNSKLQDELQGITGDSVVNDLRAADRRKGYWLNEDPTLDRMLAWIQRQR